MSLQKSENHLPHLPLGAVLGELTTALCFGCLGLFLPLLDWVRWPELLFNWHFAVVVIGALALATALVQRRPPALKLAIVFAAYIGLPSLLSLSQAFSHNRSAADGVGSTVSYSIWGLGTFGQVAVVLSCISRLAPVRPSAISAKALQLQEEAGSPPGSFGRRLRLCLAIVGGVSDRGGRFLPLFGTLLPREILGGKK
jgi:hypothetical protein